MQYNSKSIERTRKARINTIIMFVIRGLSIAISLLYVPLLLNTLNAAQYGVWLVITSIVSWVSLMDIGLGNGLRNKLVKPIVDEDVVTCKEYISSAYAALSCFIFFLLCIFIILSNNYLSWNKILNTTDIDPIELTKLVNVVFIAFGIQFILNLQNSILFAFQKPALSSIITFLSNLFSFLAVLAAVKIWGITDLLRLGCIISLTPIVVLIISSICIFSTILKKYRPDIQHIKYSKIKDTLNLGIKFFIIQIITIVLYQTNNIIITHVVDSIAVVQYNIAYKYMNVLAMAYTIIVTPIWSATTDAYVRKDFDWIKSTHKTLNKILVLAICCGLVMCLISPIIFNVWLGKDHLPIPGLTIALILIYVSFKMAYNCYGYIINGIGKIYAQLIITLIIAIIYIPTTIYMGKLFGLNGVIISSCIINILNYIWSRIQYTKIINNKASGFWDK